MGAHRPGLGGVAYAVRVGTAAGVGMSGDAPAGALPRHQNEARRRPHRPQRDTDAGRHPTRRLDLQTGQPQRFGMADRPVPDRWRQRPQCV